jgi:hypothetical protein
MASLFRPAGRLQVLAGTALHFLYTPDSVLLHSVHFFISGHGEASFPGE